MDKWGPTEMAQPGNLDLLKELVVSFSMSLSQGDAGVLHSVLKDLMEKHGSKLNKDILAQYRLLLKEFGILSWVDRSEEEKKDYLTKDLLLIIKTPLPILALIDSQIRWRKWEYKEILQQNLNYISHNLELIGSLNKDYNFSAADNRPAIKNWIKDYIIFSDSPKGLDSLKLNKYFEENKNFKLLNNDDKKTLKRILKLYTILSNPFKHSSFFQTPGLFDFDFELASALESAGESAVQAPAEAADDVINKGSRDDDNLKKIQNIYKFTLTELQKKYGIDESVKKYNNYELPKLVEILIAGIKDPKIVLSILSLIVKKDQQLDILTNQLAEKLKVTIKKQPGLKEIFMELLLGCGLSENDSAVYLLHLANYNKKLQGWAYGDLKTLTFKWR